MPLPEAIPLLYLDEALLVVAKPAGLPTLVDGYHPEAPYLLGILRQTYHPLWVVHRLDRETSGVMIFARTAQAHRALNSQFERHQIAKYYHALALGSPHWEQKTVKLPLLPDGDRRHRTTVDPRRGKPACTDLSIMERFADCTLIEAIPRTGRTHQIRAHLAALGHPLAGDQLYGGSQIAGLERVGLHAHLLTMIHPTSQQTIAFCAPYPQDMQYALDQLRQPSQR
jgi:RluA family pseudouridine synthase